LFALLPADGVPLQSVVGGALEHSHAPPASAAITHPGTTHPIFLIVTSSYRDLRESVRPAWPIGLAP
jgi:hypothetical protein